MRSLACAALAAFGMLVVAPPAMGQLLAGVDDELLPSSCYVYDFTLEQWEPVFAGVPVSGLAADDAAQVIYVSDGSVLYTWSYTEFGTNNPPTLVAGFTLDGGTIGAMNGLAWDSTNSKLYGSRTSNTTTQPEGIYEINPLDATCTLVLAVDTASYDFGGLDFNPADGYLYAANDDTTPAGRGLYQLDLSKPSITLITDYPTFAGDGGATKDIDGLAVGALTGGDAKAYFIVDQTGEVGIYNLATSMIETPFANPWNSSEVFSGGAWAGGLLVPPEGANLAIFKTDSPDPVVPPGEQLTYTITVQNFGPEDATGVTVEDVLPAEVNFVSVQPPGMFANGTVTADIGSLTAGGVVSFDIVVETTAAGTVSNTATVTGNEPDPNPNNNSATAQTTVREPLADLAVTMADSGDCVSGAGEIVTYTITVTNNGPEQASNVTLIDTLPSNANFVASNPPGTPVGGILTLSLGNLGPGANTLATIDVEAIDAGSTLVNEATAVADEDDPNSANDTASESTTILPDPPAGAVVRALFSTIASSPTSDVPGLPGAKFSSSGGIDRPFGSPSGERLILSADTDLATSEDQVLVTAHNDVVSVAAREGILSLDAGDLIGTFDTVQGINDAGQLVFSTNTNGATASDEVVVKWDGTDFVVVAREGSSVPAFVDPNVVYGSTSGSATIQSDGTVSFYTSLSGTPGGTADNNALLADDGATLIAQEGVTVPTGQAGGATEAYESFDTGATDGQGFFPAADGSTFIASADLYGPTTSDRVGVVDNAVVIQEGEILPGSGFAAGVSSLLAVDMSPSGDWAAYGSNSDGLDWVLHNGQVAAATDQPIHAGAAELYDDAPYAQTFFFALINSLGDYVVGGTTNSADDNANAVMVFNNRRVVLRENDPVDLDGNGLFDDDTYIRTFRDDFALLTSDRVLYTTVRLRDALGACTGDNTDIGQALLRIRICVADLDGDGDSDFGDLVALLGAYGVSPAGDIDGDGDTDFDDLVALLSDYGCDPLL